MDKPNNISIPEPMRRIVSGIGEQALNKKWVGFSLVATGLIGFMLFSRFKQSNQKSKTTASKSQQIPARGRVWNINLDPHESGMST